MNGLRLFSIRGIPVWISPWFFLLGAYYVHLEGMRRGLLAVMCVGASILVHELGHAVVAARYQLSPQILLHGVGGLCAHQQAEKDRHDALILVAGPLAGLLLGVLVYAIHAGLMAGGVALSADAQEVISILLFVNIIWSLVNLLPMWPLDGGRLFRLGLLQVLSPRWAERVTHSTSMLLLLGGAIYGFTGGGSMFGFTLGGPVMGFMALYLMHQNLRVFLGEARGDLIRPKNPRVKAMLADVRAAYDAGEHAEVLLRGHRLREESHLPDAAIRKLFAMLGVSTARLGRHSEALAYLQRAETNADVVEAAIECLHMLDRDKELSALLASKSFQLLSDARQREILAVVRAETTEG